MFKTIGDLKQELASAEQTLKETRKRVQAELGDRAEREKIEARLLEISRETQELWEATRQKPEDGWGTAY
jgi:outer membrane protein TolC